MPPIWRAGRKLCPLPRSFPMGFALSATVAQSLMNLTTDKIAKLPQRWRVRLGDLPPLTLPAWGTIMDDFWFVEQARRGRKLKGPVWARKVVSAWKSVGLSNHAKKDLDAEEDAELQGAVVDPARHEAGLSAEKTDTILRSMLWILLQ